MSTSTAWLRNVSILMILAFCMFLMVPVGLAQEASPSEEEGSTATEAGLGAASLLLTIPYGVFKAAFAIAGGVVGGLAYVFSGGNDETAQNIWTASAYGTWTITPDHLKGDKPVRFLGVPAEEAAGEDFSGLQ